ncbi:MAG: carbamoyl-phosphate synthase large subunit, partial [Acidaminococcaceae bacterium]|nr:carbamoyl-phosphate synthase large subunit [Acidaminococcaceae bacterium]
IERNFEAALLKAARCLEIGCRHLQLKHLAGLPLEELRRRVATQDDERLFAIAEFLRQGGTVDEVHRLTKINPWFLQKIVRIIEMERQLQTGPLTAELLRRAKKLGFADEVIAGYTGQTWQEIRQQRKAWGIIPTYKMVDTCAAEFEAATPYYYSSYAMEDEVEVTSRKKVCILGSGPIRIGQGVEFDYCTVHSVWALKELGYETIIINNNPETVSTDFDTSDKLYFEPLTVEDVLNVLDKEQPEGVIVQFGGQTAINLAGPLAKAGIQILGSSVDSIDRAEDRERFDEVLTQCEISRPRGHSVTCLEEALAAAHDVSYPVMVRPSYVLGGRAMEIVYNDEELRHYMEHAVQASSDHPVLVDHYLMGTEVEVDAICDGREVLMPGIMQHIERAGVHSGDSIAVYPPRSLSEHVIKTIIDYTVKMALNLEVKGMINVQYIVRDGNVYVIEVNPRSSRTVPFLSKVTTIPMVDVATKCAMGLSIREQGYKPGLQYFPDYYACKAPVFSFNKMSNVDITLGPEMKSTGEVMAVDYQFSRALYKACIASGINVPHEGAILITVADKDKPEATEIAAGFLELGYEVMATGGTAAYMREHGVEVETAVKISEGTPNLLDDIKEGKIAMVINTSNHGGTAERDGFRIRRSTVEHAIPCLTSLDTAKALQRVMAAMRHRRIVSVVALQDLSWDD